MQNSAVVSAAREALQRSEIALQDVRTQLSRVEEHLFKSIKYSEHFFKGAHACRRADQ